MGKQKINYSEGTCFAVPLRDAGFARGVVSRLDGKGRVLGYFFGLRLECLDPAQVRFDPKPADAILSGRFGDLGLLKGKWPLLYQLPDWNRDRWPLPVFVRTVVDTIMVSEYTDALKFIRERKLHPGEIPENACDDGLMGHGFVEIRLTKLLAAE